MMLAAAGACDIISKDAEPQVLVQIHAPLAKRLERIYLKLYNPAPNILKISSLYTTLIPLKS